MSILPLAYDISASWTNQPLRAMPLIQNGYGGINLRSDSIHYNYNYNYSFNSKFDQNEHESGVDVDDNVDADVDADSDSDSDSDPAMICGLGLIGLGPITSSPMNGNFFNSSMAMSFTLSNTDTSTDTSTRTRTSTSTINDTVCAPVTTVHWRTCEGVRTYDRTKVTEQNSLFKSNFARLIASPVSSIVNTVRAPFEERGFFQTWDIYADNNSDHDANTNKNLFQSHHNENNQVEGDSVMLTLSMVLDGPFFRQCDWPNSTSPLFGACGWGTSIPIQRNTFSISIRDDFIDHENADNNLIVMIIEDTSTPAVTVSSIWVDCSSSLLSSCPRFLISVDAALNVFRASVSLPLPMPLSAPAPALTPATATATATATASRPVWSIRQAVYASFDLDSALDLLIPTISTAYKFNQTFNRACDAFQERWEQAFQPHTSSNSSSSLKTGNGKFAHRFSGSLPSLTSSASSSSSSSSVTASIERLYYWSELALLSLERSNMLSNSHNRTYVISEGPSNSFDGSADMGGAGQFIWDLSFASISYTLLDPEVTRDILSYVIRYSDIKAVPLLIPQAWDVYVETSPGASSYCFDYISTFFFIQQYILYSGDLSFLSTSLTNALYPSLSLSVLDYLRLLASAWRAYPRSSASPYLVDYGDDKRSFLEAVPSYKGVVPALQVANAGMMRALAEMLKYVKHDNGKHREEEDDMEVTWLLGNASAIIDAVIEHQYVDGGGYFRCIYNETSSQDVRAISDFIYVGISLGVMTDSLDDADNGSSLLPEYIRKEAVNFFLSELLADGWVRALSLKDPVMAHVQDKNPDIEAKVAMRADWTGTGGYGGLAGFAVDALSVLDLDLASTISTLHNLSVVSSSLEGMGTMPAQGIAVTTPVFMKSFLNDNNGVPIPTTPYAQNFPEFFDEKNFPALWPSSSRSVQNAVASIGDSIMRTVFGWRPSIKALMTLTDKSLCDASVDKDDDIDDDDDDALRCFVNLSLFRPNVSRGDFEATMRHIYTPLGYIDLSANRDGVQWSRSQ